MSRKINSYYFHQKYHQKKCFPFLPKKGAFLILLTLMTLSVAEARAFNNTINPIELLPEQLAFVPKEFYIADIIDEREDPSAVAWLLPANTKAGQSISPQKVDLKGGGRAAIQDFIKKSLPADTKLRPLNIRLKECLITEAPGTKGGVDGSISIRMDFEFLRNGEAIHLTSYKGGVRYTRAAANTSLVEPALRQSLSAALKYLNTWMEREVSTNITLAKGVKVFISDFTENKENDTVFYSTDRPLSWSDFQAQPMPGSRYSASVFPGFSYEGDSKMVDGYVHLELSMKVYVLKNSSWVRSNARDTYSLNHEQRHFDIVKLVVEKFKKRLKSETLDPDDFDGIIAGYYIDAFREMNRLQEQYDSETQHGLDKDTQERWNRKLDEELLKII